MLPRYPNGRKEGNGDWTEVRRKNDRRDKTITSFYVSNIQSNTSSWMLKESFRGFGKLVDIYIPRRKDRSGSYFAFIKYEGVRNAMEMAKILDKVRCGHCVTRVNVSKYQKKSEFRGPPAGTNRQATHPPPPPRNFDGETHKSEGIRTSKSFAEAVGGVRVAESPQSPNLITLKPVPIIDAYSQLSLLGEVTCIQILRDLPKLIHADGRIPCQLFYVGGLKVVIKFLISRTADSFLNREHNWKRWFIWLRMGVSDDIKFDRIACIKLHGLPISLRSNDNVVAITKSIGKVVEVDGHNWSSPNLSSTTARILSESTTLINKEVLCVLNGKQYKVGMVECDDIWDPIENYYGCSAPAASGQHPLDDYNDEDEHDNNVSTDSEDDEEGISETCLNDLEEGEIFEPNGHGADGDGELHGDLSPGSLENLGNYNLPVHSVVEKSHGEMGADNSHILNMDDNGRLNGDPPPTQDFQDLDIADKGNIPTEPITPLGSRKPCPNIVSPDNGPSHFGIGLSNSKRRRIDPTMHRLPNSSVSPRRLSDVFDLNIAAPITSSVSVSSDANSFLSSTNNADHIVNIGNEVGFQLNNDHNDILAEILDQDVHGDGATSGRQ